MAQTARRKKTKEKEEKARWKLGALSDSSFSVTATMAAHWRRGEKRGSWDSPKTSTAPEKDPKAGESAGDEEPEALYAKALLRTITMSTANIAGRDRPRLLRVELMLNNTAVAGGIGGGSDRQFGVQFRCGSESGSGAGWTSPTYGRHATCVLTPSLEQRCTCHVPIHPVPLRECRPDLGLRDAHSGEVFYPPWRKVE